MERFIVIIIIVIQSCFGLNQSCQHCY